MRSPPRSALYPIELRVFRMSIVVGMEIASSLWRRRSLCIGTVPLAPRWLLTRHDGDQPLIHRAYTMPPIDLLKVKLGGPQFTPEYLALIMGKSW